MLVQSIQSPCSKPTPVVIADAAVMLGPKI